eukprot:Em0644g3a
MVLHPPLVQNCAAKAFKTLQLRPGSEFLNLVPSKVLKANRDIYKPGTARMATSYHGPFNALKIHCTATHGTIQEFEQQDPPFGVIVHMGVMDGDIHEYRAVVSQRSALVHSGDYVKLHPPFCQFTYGQLVATINPSQNIHCALYELVANNLIPDHVGSMNDVFMKDMRTPPHSGIAEVLLGGDGQLGCRILHLHLRAWLQVRAGHGVFPPASFYDVARVKDAVATVVPFHAWQEHRVSIRVVINFAAFVAAAVALYELTMEIFQSRKLSLISAALFCINPASVFMSGSVLRGRVHVPLPLGNALRSAGTSRPELARCLHSPQRPGRTELFCAGYLGFYYLKKLYEVLHTHPVAPQLCLLKSLGLVSLALLQCCAVVLPFALFQYYGHMSFCGKDVIPPSPWCQWRLPLPYFYIQQHYWDVGFMRYYQWKQVPNFLLATPMFLLCLYSLFKGTIHMLSSKSTKSFDLVLFPFLLHLLFLVFFGIFNMHVQVLTRFVASSSPVIYWFAGGALLDTLPSNCDVPDSLCQLGAAIFQRRPKESHSISNRLTPVWVWLQMTTGQLIVCYFCVYYLLGVLFTATSYLGHDWSFKLLNIGA